MSGPLPIVLSVPHAGLRVPALVAVKCALRQAEVAADGDEHAAAIFDIAGEVAHFVTTDVARAIVDVNRARDDFGADGVIKTRTCYAVPVYRAPLTEAEVAELLRAHYDPYHARLTALCRSGVRFGVDAHTMAAVGPPEAKDAGAPRPMVCIGDGHGACPPAQAERLRRCCARHFPGEVTVNLPFAGGHITRSHGQELPWVQIEVNRGLGLAPAEKRERILLALRDWCADL